MRVSKQAVRFCYEYNFECKTVTYQMFHLMLLTVMLLLVQWYRWQLLLRLLLQRKIRHILPYLSELRRTRLRTVEEIISYSIRQSRVDYHFILQSDEISISNYNLIKAHELPILITLKIGAIYSLYKFHTYCTQK